MHRFTSLQSLYQSYSRQLLTLSPNTIIFDTKLYTSCSHCKNVKNHLKADSRLLISKRLQSTHEALIPRSTRKKKKTKIHLKYVELLEVNDQLTKHTKASVTKFNSKHLSKLTASTDMSLGQLHKLKSTQVKSVNDNDIDRDLLREIENTVLNKYKQDENTKLKKDEDDGPVIIMSESFLNQQPFQDKYLQMLLKDSYDKFRRETVRDQKMKDLICAINEGVNQNINPNVNTDVDGFDSTNNHMELPEHSSANVLSTKGAHEIFRECLSEFKQLNYDSLDFDNLKHIEELKFRGIHVPCISEIAEELDTLESEELNISHQIDEKKKENNIVPKEKSKKIQSKMKKVLIDQLAKQKFEDLQKNSRIHSLTQLLMAHLEICIAVGSVNKGLQVLQYYRNRGMKSKNHAFLKDVNLYNLLLHGLAGVGDLSNIVNVLNIMKTDSVAMNSQSYAAVFECVQRSDLTDKLSKLNEFKDEMLSKGIKLNDLMDKCKFTKDQGKYVLDAIRQLEPGYKPCYSYPLLKYSSPLVARLNPNKCNHQAYTSPAKGLINPNQLMSKVLKQIDNEIAGAVSIENIKNVGIPTETILYCREKLNQWEEEWKDVARKSFARNLNALRSQSSASHQALNFYPYLCALEVDEYVELLLLEIRKFSDGSETYSPTVKLLQRELGLKVFNRYLIRSKQKDGTMDKIIDLYSKYCNWYINREKEETEKYNSRRKWQQILHENRAGASMDIEENQWPVSICVGVGTFLYNILMNDIKVDINIFKRNTKTPKHMPALYMVYRGQGYNVHQELKPHPLLVRLVRESCPPHLQLSSSLVPSLCPPLPWSSHSQGGYLLTRTALMRATMGAGQQIQRLEEAPASSLYPALDSLNQLGSVPWKVNTPVLDLLMDVFRSGGSRSLKVTQPAHAAPLPPPPSASLSRRERAAAQRTRAALARQRQEMHSLWCDSLYKLSLANHYRDDIFWLPHNMDFRGRVYPCNPHLSHLGNDQSRAVMLFARGAPLGPDGLRWLKLHCISLTGLMKKETLDERLEYCDSIMEDILDSADRPLEGRRWWAQSEKPWQTLACCMEIANASRAPDPREYVCHFPVHQDGSCNGLQHYAALGGDSAGAYSVNLTPADRPQDVYSAVVNLVEASRAREAEAGVPIAKALEGFIKRKVIKQTVMTTVYGVTRFGARLQIVKQLKDLDKFPKDLVWSGSSYLTSKTFESLREMFTSTKEIQDWFTDCAKVISGVCSEKVEWVTPLGLPVVQPYHKPSKVHYSSNGNVLEYASYDQHEKPCVVKQRNAFPPNFIHSLDSSHMMLTSLHCEAENITFVSVHDCFWTHPSTVDIMNKVCREQFVSLHSQPILDDLSAFLVKRYDSPLSDIEKDSSANTKLNNLLTRIPKKGDFNLKNVLNSVYFFS